MKPLCAAGMIALAFKIEQMTENGELRDRAEVACAFGFPRPRVTQLLELTLLTPDIVEEIVFLEHDGGVERLSERSLRAVLKAPTWEGQRKR